MGVHSIHPQRKKPLQIVRRIDPETDQRFRIMDAFELPDVLRHQIGQVFVGVDADDRNEIAAACHRVHLGNTFHIDELLGHFVDFISVYFQEDKGSKHKAISVWARQGGGG